MNSTLIIDTFRSFFKTVVYALKKDYIIKSKRLKRGKNVSLLRHDMRHFLNNIAAFIENNENDKA